MPHTRAPSPSRCQPQAHTCSPTMHRIPTSLSALLPHLCLRSAPSHDACPHPSNCLRSGDFPCAFLLYSQSSVKDGLTDTVGEEREGRTRKQRGRAHAAMCNQAASGRRSRHRGPAQGPVTTERVGCAGREGTHMRSQLIYLAYSRDKQHRNALSSN